ncbi:MAG: AMP-binding protein, partial [Mycobacteriales bacterium]
MTTIAELLARRADDDNVALLAGEQIWRWRQVVAAAAVRASLLRSALPTTAPPHVGVLLGNVPEYVLTLFAAALSEAVVVGINPMRRGAELARDIRHTDCQLVLTDAGGAALLAGLDLGGTSVLRVDEPAWEGLLGPHRGAAAPTRLPVAESLYLLTFTSGSTSEPKAVRRTQGRLATSSGLGFRPGDILYCAMPLCHGNALSSNVMPALQAGATIVLREKFSASQFLPDVRRYGVTFFNTVGRALGYILATPPTAHDRDHSLRTVLAPEASPSDSTEFAARFGARVVSGYGSSEGAIV